MILSTQDSGPWDGPAMGPLRYVTPIAEPLPVRGAALVIYTLLQRGGLTLAELSAATGISVRALEQNAVPRALAAGRIRRCCPPREGLYGGMRPFVYEAA